MTRDEQKQADLASFQIQLRQIAKRFKELEAEQPEVSPVSPRMDEIMSEKNALRIRAMSLKIRMQRMGKLTEYAVSELLKSIPKL